MRASERNVTRNLLTPSRELATSPPASGRSKEKGNDLKGNCYPSSMLTDTVSDLHKNDTD